MNYNDEQTYWNRLIELWNINNEYCKISINTLIPELRESTMNIFDKLLYDTLHKDQNELNEERIEKKTIDSIVASKSTILNIAKHIIKKRSKVMEVLKYK